jgi:LPXTG-motif cell wall-anchored protein
MDTATVIQVVAGILFVAGLVVLIQRHRKKVA